MNKRVPWYFGLAAILAGPLVASFMSISSAQPTRPPELNQITPASAPAGQAYPVRATLQGAGFAPSGNVVEFGPVRISDLTSADGKQITFDVPKVMRSPGAAQQIVLIPGQYRVSVTTSAGTSNALT